MRMGALASIIINTNVAKKEDAVDPYGYARVLTNEGKFTLVYCPEEREEEKPDLTEEEQDALWEKTKLRLMSFAGKRLGTEEEIAARQAAEAAAKRN